MDDRVGMDGSHIKATDVDLNDGALNHKNLNGTVTAPIILKQVLCDCNFQHLNQNGVLLIFTAWWRKFLFFIIFYLISIFVNFIIYFISINNHNKLITFKLLPINTLQRSFFTKLT